MLVFSSQWREIIQNFTFSVLLGKKSQINNWTEKIQAMVSFWPGYQLRQQKKLSGLG